MFSSSSRFTPSLPLSADMLVVLWLGLYRGSGGSSPWNRSEVRSFRGFEVSRLGVGAEA